MPYLHFVARAHHSLHPLVRREDCADLWARLRKRFEHVAACVLMPNHLHLITECSRPTLAHHDLYVELRAFSRKAFPGNSTWEKVPIPRVIPDLSQLKRQIRYVHLNPCRAELVSDPLEWEWSTHRDAVRAAHPGWLDRTTLARIFRVRQADLASAMHCYISSDPSVRVTGTPPPGRNQKTSFASLPIASISHAIESAARTFPHDRLSRTTFRRRTIHLAYRRHRPHPQELETLLGCSRRTVYWNASQLLTSDDEEVLRAAELILSDPRLMHRL